MRIEAEDQARGAVRPRAAVPSCSAVGGEEAKHCESPASPIRWCRALPRAGPQAIRSAATFRPRRAHHFPHRPQGRDEAKRRMATLTTNWEMTVVVYMDCGCAMSRRAALLGRLRPQTPVGGAGGRGRRASSVGTLGIARGGSNRFDAAPPFHYRRTWSRSGAVARFQFHHVLTQTAWKRRMTYSD